LVRPAIAALVIFVGASFARAADEPGDAIVGVWRTEQGEGKIRIFRCGAKYCGKLIWIRPSKQLPYPSQLTDYKNPDPAKRDRKMIGVTILRGLTYDADDGVYEGGRIYDNTRGDSFRCRAWVQHGGQTLKLRGFVGVSLLGQNTYWSRVK
jgi:uncharacterized protein (DUF2147 family)